MQIQPSLSISMANVMFWWTPFMHSKNPSSLSDQWGQITKVSSIWWHPQRALKIVWSSTFSLKSSTQKLVINKVIISSALHQFTHQTGHHSLRRNRTGHGTTVLVLLKVFTQEINGLPNWHPDCQIMLKMNMIFFGQIHRVQHVDELGNIPHKGVSILTLKTPN